MDEYNSYDRRYGYNICCVAGNCLGVKRSLATRKKMQGNTNGSYRMNYKVSDATKRKMSISAKNRIVSGMKGKKHSDEAKLKMRIAKLGKRSSKFGKVYRKDFLLDFKNFN